MSERLEKVKKLIDDIAYYNRLGSGDLEEIEWLIEQAEKAEKIQKFSNAEDITLADFAKETLRIIEGREVPTRKERR